MDWKFRLLLSSGFSQGGHHQNNIGREVNEIRSILLQASSLLACPLTYSIPQHSLLMISSLPPLPNKPHTLGNNSSHFQPRVITVLLGYGSPLASLPTPSWHLEVESSWPHDQKSAAEMNVSTRGRWFHESLHFYDCGGCGTCGQERLPWETNVWANIRSREAEGVHG